MMKCMGGNHGKATFITLSSLVLVMCTFTHYSSNVMETPRYPADTLQLSYRYRVDGIVPIACFLDRIRRYRQPINNVVHIQLK